MEAHRRLAADGCIREVGAVEVVGALLLGQQAVHLGGVVGERRAGDQGAGANQASGQGSGKGGTLHRRSPLGIVEGLQCVVRVGGPGHRLCDPARLLPATTPGSRGWQSSTSVTPRSAPCAGRAAGSSEPCPWCCVADPAPRRLLGHLEGGDLSLKPTTRAAPSKVAPGLGTTTASTPSPKSGCGAPMTALSATPGMSFR